MTVTFCICSICRLIIPQKCQSVYLLPPTAIISMVAKVTIPTILFHTKETSHLVKHHFQLSAPPDHPTGLSDYIGLARRAESIIKQGELPKLLWRTLTMQRSLPCLDYYDMVLRNITDVDRDSRLRGACGCHNCDPEMIEIKKTKAVGW